MKKHLLFCKCFYHGFIFYDQDAFRNRPSDTD
nr:MAG TPA: hypothetical protein [Caudoviricetes sp.]